MFMLPRRALHVPGRWPVPLALGLGVGLLVGYGLSARPGAAAAGPAIACQATPGPATATPVGSGRYTPAPTAGAVKPLPGKTAVPPAPPPRVGHDHPAVERRADDPTRSRWG